MVDKVAVIYIIMVVFFLAIPLLLFLISLWLELIMYIIKDIIEKFK